MRADFAVLADELGEEADIAREECQALHPDHLQTERARLTSTLPINQNSTDSLIGKFSQFTTKLPMRLQFFEVKLLLQDTNTKP